MPAGGARMAGLIGLTAADIDVQDALGAVRWSYEGEWVPHPVVRLTTTLPVAVTADDGAREVVRARWGFQVGPRPVGNARDDKLEASPMWSKMLGDGHCLVASTGIYEMADLGEGKQAYWFRRRDGTPIVMPGLCQVRSVKGEERLCAAIVTTEPEPFFRRFHNRQVATLAGEECDAWMDADAQTAVDLLHPPAPDEWETVPVDRRIFAPGRREMHDLVETGPPLRWRDGEVGEA